MPMWKYARSVTSYVLASLALTAWPQDGEPQTLRQGHLVGGVDWSTRGASLTRIEQLVAGSDGRVYILDSNSPAVLVFERGTGFVGQIGAEGPGPGEFSRPWRLGLRGDTLWVVDGGGGEIELFAVGGSSADETQVVDTWRVPGRFARPVQPFGLLADGRVLGLVSSDLERSVGLLALPRNPTPSGAASAVIARVDVTTRLVRVPIPAGGGGLQLRNPFSHADMFSLGPEGRRVVIVKRPFPEGGAREFQVRIWTVATGEEVTLRIRYAPVPLGDADIESWIGRLDAVEELAQFGAFPSQRAGRVAVREALDAPLTYPPVRNTGRGILEEGVIVGAGDRVWLQLNDPEVERAKWVVLDDSGTIGTVDVPPSLRVLAVAGDTLWAELKGPFGVPRLKEYRVEWP